MAGEGAEVRGSVRRGGGGWGGTAVAQGDQGESARGHSWEGEGNESPGVLMQLLYKEKQQGERGDA